MIIKNAYIWTNGKFIKKDLYFEKGEFVSESSENSKIINLERKYILPGFSDSHAHILGVGIKVLTINLDEFSFEQIFKAKNDVILGRGWEELPENIHILDEIQKPIILIRKCGHVAWLNKTAQKYLKFKNYLIYEQEIEKIWSLLPDDFYIKAFKKGEEEFLKYGITSVHSDDFHGISFEILENLLKESKLRIYEKLNTAEPWNYNFGSYGISKIFGIKLFADGSLGGKTAYLSSPYKESDSCGKFVLPNNFSKIVDFANKNNLQVCVHTIGDEALTRVLDLFGRNFGHRIIHAQLIKESDFPRLKNFVFSIQPHFAIEDKEIIKNVSLKNVLFYPFKRMYENKIRISFSSDAPVSPHNPQYVIKNALKIGFSFEESIKLYTETSGEIINEKIGKLKPGYKADFVVFNDTDLTSIHSVFVNGEKVYSSLT